MIFRLITVALLANMALSQNAFAASYTVCDAGCNYTTIAAALTAAGNGNHTVTVQGTYTAAENITISNSGTDDTHRFTIVATAKQTVKRFIVSGEYVTIDNFTFDGFATQYSGMVQLPGRYLTLQNCIVKNTTSAMDVSPITYKKANGLPPVPIPDIDKE